MRTCILTTCVGRWRFLEQAYATWCKHLGETREVDEVLCVTSEQCSDVTGVKARKLGMRVVEVVLETAPMPAPEAECSGQVQGDGRPLFHKSRMLNCGAQWAMREGFGRLLLLDADTLVLPGFAGQLALVPERGYFAFCSSPLTKRDLAGVLVVNTEDWEKVGGMDERIRNWGAEDLDMRLRLWGETDLRYVRLNPSFLQPMSHSDDLRMELMQESNKYASLTTNNWIMAANYFRRCGRHLAEDMVDSVELQELLGLADELTQVGATLKRAGGEPT